MVEINLAVILASIINFGILLFVLKRLFWTKMLGIIDQRENSIKEAYVSAMDNDKKAKELLEEQKENLAKSKAQGREIVEDYKKKAEVLSKDIIEEAHTEAKTVIERARTESEREREKLVDELRVETVDLAVSMSQKALESTIDEKEHRRLINDFLSKVGN